MRSYDSKVVIKINKNEPILERCFAQLLEEAVLKSPPVREFTKTSPRNLHSGTLFPPKGLVIQLIQVFGNLLR